MQTKSRITYGIVFSGILLAEVLIALFMDDKFIRPYVGDMLVTVLICCLCRVVMPTGVRALPIYVFLFAAAVEIGQYFDVVEFLGLENSRFISVILGRTFSAYDLLCYAVGCLVFFVVERIVRKHRIPGV